MANSFRASARAQQRYRRSLDAVSLSAPGARRAADDADEGAPQRTAKPTFAASASASKPLSPEELRGALVSALREDKATADVLRSWLTEELAGVQRDAPEAAQPVESAAPRDEVTAVPESSEAEAESEALAPGVRRLRRAAAPVSDSAPPMMPARCSEHGGQHYRGAREQDVVDVWKAMRENYQRSAPNKVAARKSLMRWLELERGVCPESIAWYLDFFVVRSCPARAPEGHPARREAGWYIAFDPNGDKYLRNPLFAEAFDGAGAGFGGVTPRLQRPAWISEAERASIAQRLGEPDVRPFPPNLLDGATSAAFHLGRTEH